MLECLNNLPVWLTSLISVFVGALVSSRATKRNQTMHLLAEFYAEVFSAYTSAALLFETAKVMELHAAIEKAKLLCSKESEAILISLQRAISETTPNRSKTGALLAKLRDSAKRDLRKK